MTDNKEYIISVAKHKIYPGRYMLRVTDLSTGKNVMVKNCKNHKATKLLVEFCKIQYNVVEIDTKGSLSKLFFTG